TSTNTVIETIAGFSGPFGIAITPNGNYAYVTNFGSNNFAPFGTTVSVIDIAINSVVETIDLGIQPAGIAITPNGNFAYVSNYNTLYAGAGFTDLTAGQGTISVIDLIGNFVISSVIAVGQSPDAIAISPNGQFAYVTNYTSNSVNVIALQSFEIVAQGSQIQNQYLTQTQLVNKLTWTASGTSLPVSYSIYRDAGLTDLAGTVSAADPLEFFDYNQVPKSIYFYYLTGTNQMGITSNPVTVVIDLNEVIIT
ncbi:MAG: YncE family protein, partial [Candidatus Dependentiae bacterium]|nr:YncE family protein [Candidatus Dependentiae bacterium]